MEGKLYKAFSEGIQAYKDGKRALDNPYGTEAVALHNAWASGWITEERFQKQA